MRCQRAPDVGDEVDFLRGLDVLEHFLHDRVRIVLVDKSHGCHELPLREVARKSLLPRYNAVGINTNTATFPQRLRVMPAAYDIIIIGAGHNGLVTASYLA